MEESPFVSDTLDMVLDMHERHGSLAQFAGPRAEAVTAR